MKLDIKRVSLAVPVVLAAAIAGCASAPIPADKYANAKSSIKTSEELGAEQDPQAALHLKLAKEQLAQAKDCMKKGDNESAKMVLERAEADGDAAFNIARADKAKVEAKKTVENIQQQMQALQAGTPNTMMSGSTTNTTTTSKTGSGR